MKQQKLVLFDIDGTLLYSRDAALRLRFDHAIEKVHGKKVTVAWDQYEGAIDSSILVTTMQLAGIPDQEINDKLSHVYEAAFEYFVNTVKAEEYAQTLLLGTHELLQTLQNQVYIGLLTGNIEKIAWHKLALVGLRDYFAFGVFGHEADTRDNLARLVHQKAKQHFGLDFSSDHIFFVGDTPRDISCARAIDAKVIAVPTGKYSKDQLSAHHPDLLAENLFDPKITELILGKQSKNA